LAYNFPKSLSNKIGFEKIRTYVSGTNLITFTNYSGYDPEVSAYNYDKDSEFKTSSNDAMIGVDLSNYPTAKIITFGIEVSF
jgi:hypothetical protein